MRQIWSGTRVSRVRELVGTRGRRGGQFGGCGFWFWFSGALGFCCLGLGLGLGIVLVVYEFAWMAI